MGSIESRRDLASLLEKQMSVASLRAPAASDEELEQRTALKTFLLEAHGPLRKDPVAVLAELCPRAGLDLKLTADGELFELTQGDLTLWLDTTHRRYLRLHTTIGARDADRIHEALVQVSPLLEPAWLLPANLESLAARLGGRMALFSLRHDRRALRREPDESPTGLDLVTLRFWAPSAAQTLERLRNSQVLPGATSVNSARVRLGSPEAYALAEVYHHGKLTAVGNSFGELEKILRVLTADASELAERFENGGSPRAVRIPLRWTAGDLEFALARIFSGGEPFRLWGLLERTGEHQYRARAIDVGVGRPASFLIDPESITVEAAPGTPAGVLTRFVANLQFHVHSETRSDSLSQEPLLARAAAPGLVTFDERSALPQVARVVLSEAAAQWLRGQTLVHPVALVHGVQGAAQTTPAMVDLARRVLSEAAAYEWREWLRPTLDAEKSTVWRWLTELPFDATARARELTRLNKFAQALVARLGGGAEGPWTQLSLFDAAMIVPPVDDPGEP